MPFRRAIMDVGTVAWAAAGLVGSIFVPIVAFALWVQWRSSHLQSVAGKATAEGSCAEGVVVPGAPTPVQAFRTPKGTPFLAFSQYEANILVHEMYHGSTESRVSATGLQHCGTEAPFIVDVRGTSRSRQPPPGTPPPAPRSCPRWVQMSVLSQCG